MTTHKLSYLSVGVLALILGACSKPPEAPAVVRMQSATVTQVALQPMSRTLQLSGILVAREEAAVSTELNGYRVVRVFVEPGAQVQMGQTLATLDDTLLKSQIAQQEALVAQQQVAYERAGQEAERVKGLDEAGALSREIVTERTLAARSAKAVLAQAEAQLADLKTRQGLMTVRAPVAGTVLTRTVRPGDVASPSSAMFTLSRDKLVELDAEVPESDLATLGVDTAAEVTLSSGKRLAGSVRLISPEVDEKTKLGKVRIALPVDPALKPGGYGSATIHTGTREVVTVPVTSVQYNADGASIMVMDTKQVVQRRTIRTGAISGNAVEVVSGVKAGDMVVAAGAALLLPGDKIKPVTIKSETVKAGEQ
jgi:HlyD family secretion protein